MAIRFPRPATTQVRASPLKPGERDLLNWLSQTYAGRPTISLDDFRHHFACGRGGKPMHRKTALNQIYRGAFPVTVTNDRILLFDIAVWLYQSRTKDT